MELPVARGVKDDLHLLHGVAAAQIHLPPVSAEGVAGAGVLGAPLGGGVAVVGPLRLLLALGVDVDGAGRGGLVQENVHGSGGGLGMHKAGLVGVAALGHFGQALHGLGGNGEGGGGEPVTGGLQGDVTLATGGAHPHGPLTAPHLDRLLADDKTGALSGEVDGVVGGVDHGAVFIPHVHPHQLGGAAVQLQGLVVLGGEGDLGGGAGGLTDVGLHGLTVEVGHRFQGALAGGVAAEIKGEGGMGQILGGHVGPGVGRGVAGGVVGVTVGSPHLGVRGLTGDELVVQIQLHLVTVGVHPHLVGGIAGPGIGDVHHGTGVQTVLGHVQVGVGLGLEEVSAVLGDTGHVYHAAEGELVHVKSGVVGVIPVGSGAVPGLAAVEGKGGLDVVTLGEHTLVAALGVGVVLGFPGDTGGGVKAAEVPVAVLADDDGLVGILGGVAHHVGLGSAHADVKHVPVDPAAGVGLGVAHLGVLLLHQVVHVLGPGSGEGALVQAGLPGHHGAVVAVDPHLIPHLLIGVVLEGLGIAVVLPASQTVQHGHAVAVAGLIEGGVVGVVAHADEVEAVLFQPLHIFKNGVVALGVAQHVGLRVEVGAHQLHALIVDVAAVPLPLHLADAVGGLHGVDDSAVLLQDGAHGVQLGGVHRPQAGVGHGEVLAEGVLLTTGHSLGVLLVGHHAVPVHDLGDHGHGSVRRAGVLHLSLGVDGGGILGHAGRGEEHAATGHGVGLNGVSDVHVPGDGDIHVPVQAAEVLEVRVGLAGGEGGVGTGVQLHRQHVLPVKLHLVGDVKGEFGVAALVDAQLFAVEPHGGLLHGTLKGEDDLLTLHGGVHGEVSAIPEHTQVLMVVVLGGVLDGAVGGVDVQPLAVVGVYLVGVQPVPFVESPVVVEVQNGSPALAGAALGGGTALGRGRGDDGDHPQQHHGGEGQRQESFAQVSHCAFSFPFSCIRGTGAAHTAALPYPLRSWGFPHLSQQFYHINSFISIRFYANCPHPILWVFY